MTAKNTAEKSQTQAKQQQSLKGALTDVLARNEPPKSEKSPQPAPKPLPPAPGQDKQPFEVSEEDLRKVFKGEA